MVSEGKTNERPWIVVTNGTPGSGKSSLVDKVRARCHLLEGSGIVVARIDDLVEADAEYKDGVFGIVGANRCIKKEKDWSPDHEMFEKFSKLYMDVRKNGSKDKELDEVIKEAISLGRNIVFETQGTYFVQWLLDMLGGKYDIFYAFTIVRPGTNVKRTKGRAKVALEAFIRNRNMPAPRLTEISETTLIDKWKQIIPTLRTALRFATELDYLRVLAFDNNGNAADNVGCGDSAVLVDSALRDIKEIVGVR
jgi:hypothetical protein